MRELFIVGEILNPALSFPSGVEVVAGEWRIGTILPVITRAWYSPQERKLTAVSGKSRRHREFLMGLAIDRRFSG